MVVSTNPLSTVPGNDSRLLGRWITKTEDETGYIQFDEGPHQTMRVSMFGDQLTPDHSNQTYAMFTTRFGGNDYMNLKFTGPKDQRYVIVRYTVTKDKLGIWLLAGDKIKSAIVAGKLKGKEIEGNTFSAFEITDKSANISAFIQSSSEDVFFHCVDYYRVRTNQ